MLDELELLLVSIALGEIPNRQSATAYSTMRLTLLQSFGSDVVPGFLHQCISVYKYREFITLYDGRPAERRRFITTAFDRLYSSSTARAGSTDDVKPEYVSRVF